MENWIMFAKVFAIALAAWVGCAPAMAQVASGGAGGAGGSSTITGPVGPSTAPASAVSTTDTGTPITGQTLPTGGQGVIGWLSAIYSSVTQALAAQGSHGTLIGAVEGQSASGASVTENPVANGGRAQNAENTAVTNGQKVNQAYDLTGKTITSPFANRENMLRCAVTITASTTATTCTGMGAQGASVKIYITDFTCTRNDAGTTAVSLTLSDSATTIVDLPNSGGGGGYSHTFNVPLVVAANAAFQITSGTSISSLHCSATGFAGY